MVWSRGEGSSNGNTQHIQETGSSADSGHARLHELGYKQELKRDLS